MFEDESVDVVYTSHTFHYFSWDEAPGVLLEWKRIIRPTGRLFISVPNVEALLSVYEKTREVHLIRGPLLGTMPDGLGGSIHTQMIYNHSTLRSLMTMCGFNNVDTFSPDDIIGNNDDYSRSYYPHQGSSGIHLSVNLVGWKE
jgi:predicted SAM-dependent methyltransferase